MCGVAEVALGMAIMGTVMQVGGQMHQARAARQQGEYQAQVARNNQVIAERNAAIAIQQGETKKAQQRLRTAQLIGKQRAGFASSGVLVDAGSALTTTMDTAYLGKYEEQMIGYDAELEAYNYRASAMGYGAEAGLARARGQSGYASGMMGATGTLLQGGSAFADKWSSRKTPKET